MVDMRSEIRRSISRPNRGRARRAEQVLEVSARVLRVRPDLREGGLGSAAGETRRSCTRKTCPLRLPSPATDPPNANGKASPETLDAQPAKTLCHVLRRPGGPQKHSHMGLPPKTRSSAVLINPLRTLPSKKRREPPQTAPSARSAIENGVATRGRAARSRKECGAWRKPSQQRNTHSGKEAPTTATAPHRAALGLCRVRRHASPHAAVVGATHLRGGRPMRGRHASPQ